MSCRLCVTCTSSTKRSSELLCSLSVCQAECEFRSVPAARRAIEAKYLKMVVPRQNREKCSTGLAFSCFPDKTTRWQVDPPRISNVRDTYRLRLHTTAHCTVGGFRSLLPQLPVKRFRLGLYEFHFVPVGKQPHLQYAHSYSLYVQHNTHVRLTNGSAFDECD